MEEFLGRSAFGVVGAGIAPTSSSEWRTRSTLCCLHSGGLAGCGLAETIGHVLVASTIVSPDRTRSPLYQTLVHWL